MFSEGFSVQIQTCSFSPVSARQGDLRNENHFLSLQLDRDALSVLQRRKRRLCRPRLCILLPSGSDTKIPPRIRIAAQTHPRHQTLLRRLYKMYGLRYSAYVPLVYYSKFAWLTQDIKGCIGQNISILFLNRIVPCLFYWRMFIEQRIWWTFFWLIARVSRGDSSLCFCSIKASKNQ